MVLGRRFHLLFRVGRTSKLNRRTGAVSAQWQLALTDRKGGVELLKLPPGAYEAPRVSPDGSRTAFETDDGKEAIVWIYELSGATAMMPLTFGSNNRFPTWSSDSKRVAFQSDRDGDAAIWWQATDGGPAERLTRPGPGESHGAGGMVSQGGHAAVHRDQ